MKSRNLTIVGLAMTAILLGSCDDKVTTQQEIWEKDAQEMIPKLKKRLDGNYFHNEHYIGTNGTYYVYGDMLDFFLESFWQKWSCIFADLYFGKSQDDMDLVDEVELGTSKELDVNPFETYYIKFLPYVQFADDDIKHYWDTTIGPIKVIALPKNIYCRAIDCGEGYGEMGTSLKLSLEYHTEHNYDMIPFDMDCQAVFDLKSEGAKQVYKTQVEFPFGCDSVYLSSSREVPAYDTISKLSYYYVNYSSLTSCHLYDLVPNNLNLIYYRSTCKELNLLTNNNDTIPIVLRGGGNVVYFCDNEQYVRIDKVAYPKIVMGNKTIVNVPQKADIPNGYHLASNDDWLDYEETLGIERENIESYYRFGDNTFTSGVNTIMDNEDLYCNVINNLVGQDSYIANQVIQYLKPKHVYIDSEEALSPVINYYLYNTSTVKSIDGVKYVACRLFMEGHNGVFRCLVPKEGRQNYSYTDNIPYQIVQD